MGAAVTLYTSITWNSSNTNIASVGTNGLVTAGSTNGTADIQFYNSSAKSRVIFSAKSLLGALDLTGATDLVSVPHNNSLEPGSNFTLEMWVRFPNGVSGSIILEKAAPDGTGRYSYSLNMNSNGRLAFFRQNANANKLESFIANTAFPTDGNWHHVAVTRSFASNTGTIRMLIDGTPYTNFLTTSGITNDTASNTQALSIGAKSDGADNANLQIDEIRLWNETKAASYFTAATRNNPVAAPYPTALKAYFKMDKINLLKVSNEITTAASGTLENMTGQELVSR